MSEPRIAELEAENARLRQQTSRWIPGPPPEDASERCLVTTAVASTGKRYASTAFKLAPGHWVNVTGAGFRGEIVAWMPWPEPWEGEES